MPSFKLPIARGKFLSIKNQGGLDADYYLQIARLNAKPESRNHIVYRRFIMIPVVLIVATDSVYKCFTTQGATINFLVSFNIVLLCKYFFLYHASLHQGT